MQNRENILIYTDMDANRSLKYVLNFVFNQRLSLEYRLTTDRAFFSEYIGAKISYATEAVEQEIWIPRHAFMTQQRKPQYLKSSEEFIVSDLTANQQMFSTSSEFTTGDEAPENREQSLHFDFDVVSSIFVLLTRMVNVLSFKTRRLIYNTFELEKTPVIDDWILRLADYINQKHKMALYEKKDYSRSQLRVDVPKMYAYKYMGIVRSILEAINEINRLDFRSLFNRILVNLNLKRDPMLHYYDHVLPSLAQHANVILFFPLSEYNNRDRNTSYYSSIYRDFIKSMGDKYEIGLLISEKAMHVPSELTKEISRYEELTHRKLKWVSLSTTTKRDMSVLSNFDQMKELKVAGLDNHRKGFSFGTTYPFSYYNFDKKRQQHIEIYPSSFFIRNQSLSYDKRTIEILRSVIMKNRLMSIHLDLMHLPEESLQTIVNLVENRPFVVDVLKVKDNQ